MLDHIDIMWRTAEHHRRVNASAQGCQHNYPAAIAFPLHDASTGLTDPRPVSLARVLHTLTPTTS